MQRFLTVMFVWLAIIVAAAVLMYRSIQHEKPVTASIDKQRYARQLALLRTVQNQYQAQQYPLALQLLESGHAMFTREQVPDQLSLAYYLLKGKVHWSLWEFVEADQAWQAAEHLTRTLEQRRRLMQLTRDSRRVVNDINRERNKRRVYLASTHVGPASALKGKIALIYIYVVDGNSTGWSLKQRSYVQHTWLTAQNWLQDKAKAYGSQVSFSQHRFLVDKNPMIKRLRIGDVTSHFKNTDQVVSLVAQQLGYPDMLRLSQQIKKQEHADQAMVLLHFARDGRSFASRCMHKCPQQGEFVILFESTKRKKWQSMQYAQAHESLHLFGADDLYNIKKAKYYDVRDIMNYPSSQLQVSTLEQLTAWSVGLVAEKPATPFKIKTFH